MRQAISGFAIGFLSIALLFVPFFMVLTNTAPDYTTAVLRVADRSGVAASLRQESAELAQYREEFMAVTDRRINRTLFSRIP